MIKLFLLLILMIGISLVIIQLVLDNNITEGISNTNIKPQDFNTYTLSDYVTRNVDYNLVTGNYDVIPKQARVGEIFRDMFTDATPWLASVQNYDRKKQEIINQYFINLV